MKRVLTLLSTAVWIFAFCGTAAAVDITVSGTWQIGMGVTGNTGFYDGRHGADKEDPFTARQLIRPQIDFIASETLRAVLAFEIGTTVWGRPSDGGALDADGSIVELRRAYLEWSPVEKLTVRMGIQGVALPGAAFGNPVLDADVAGVVAGYAINDMFTLNTFWLRPFDASTGEGNGKNMKDEMDVFGFTLPISAEQFTLTPWGAYARVGNESGYWDYRSDYSGGYTLTDTTGALKGYSNLWWLGTAVELKFFEPFSLKLDAMYGAASGKDAPEFAGWLTAGLFEYNSGTAWGNPGLLGWYGSGDKNGSYNSGRYGKYGRMPVIGADNGGFAPTTMGYAGSNGVEMTDKLISGSGVGTWGVGLQLDEFSFMDKLTHLARVAYIRGSNDESTITKGGEGRYGESYSLQDDMFYLTKKDQAVEFDFVSKYAVNENLSIFLETAYIYMDLNRGVWGKAADTSNAWKAEMIFLYSF